MSEIVETAHLGHPIKAGKLPGRQDYLARAFTKGGETGGGIVAQTEGATAQAAIRALKAKLDALETARHADRRIHPDTGLAVPSTQEYETALHRAALSKAQIAMLQAHAAAGEDGLTAGALAAAAGYRGHETANALYGRAGRAIGDILALPAPQSATREGDIATMLLAFGGPADPETGHFVWVMYPELRQAVNAAL
ncbi:hypothetical protein Ga0609869_002647 [Rhodovulum iodosum]|uniref:Uncharacterized protein n=1 Tax=Rhodovulum iodosum TaxID=68291 RepID=A0ABV3XVW2_9RHOB|nr:hypothetical protein [Rhodovulum robiginosum]RSK33527.1 hypothetical protein EJA01_09545 [Rhodovulum robiginosum]